VYLRGYWIEVEAYKQGEYVLYTYQKKEEEERRVGCQNMRSSHHLPEHW
jgi:hypothetical protein